MSIAEKLTTIAENEQKVYDAGQKSEYDRFWESYQENGNRTNYNGAFYGKGWSNETFKPKYDIKPTGNGVVSILRETSITGDLKAILDDLGVVLDTSKCTSFSYSFYNNLFEKLPLIDMSGAGTVSVFEVNPNLKELEIKVSEKTTYNNTFNRCPALENFIVHGVIGQNGFNVSSSTKLTKESILGRVATKEQIDSGVNLVELNGTYYYGGIFGALKTLSGTSLTITLGSTNLEKLTDEEKAIATQKGWTLA